MQQNQLVVLNRVHMTSSSAEQLLTKKKKNTKSTAGQGAFLVRNLKDNTL